MKVFFFFFASLALASCSSSKNSTSSIQRPGSNGQTNARPVSGNTRTVTVEYIDERTYMLTEKSDDKTYAYDRSNPVKVGGVKESSGPANERRYLNGLAGPNGEEIGYQRFGSCCPFTTPNGTFQNSGMLDIYMVYWKGGKDTFRIFINMYDEGDLKIPVGLTAKKP